MQKHVVRFTASNPKINQHLERTNTYNKPMGAASSLLSNDEVSNELDSYYVKEDVLLSHQDDEMSDEFVDEFSEGLPPIPEVMLTTSDNPFDPFEQFDEWFAFDESMNYHSCSYLARIARTSDELSDYDNLLELSNAIDEIVMLNILGIYKKAFRKAS